MSRFGDLSVRALGLILPPLSLIVFAWSFVFYQGFGLVDDAYISFRYVDNLVAGHGLVWNPGEAVEGYTNLLWLLLLAPFAALGYDLVLPSIFVGTAFSVGTLELLRRLAARALPHRPPLIHALPGLLLALNPSFAHWTASGMETPVFVFFVLLAASELLRGRGERRAVVLVGAFVGAYLTRPEGALVAGLLLLCHVFWGEGEGESWKARFRQTIVWGLPLLAVVAIHVALRLATYGYPLPNTFYAKVIVGGFTVARGALHILAFLTCAGLLVLPGLLLLRRADDALKPALRCGYLLLGAYVLYLLIIGGDHPAWNRFYMPLLALPFIGLAELLARLAKALESPRVQLLATIGALFLVLLTVPGWRWGEVSQISYVRMTRTAGDWLVRHFVDRQVPRKAYIAAAGVGYLGYYTPVRILDTWGLNDAHIAHREVPPDRSEKFGHDKTDWIYVLSKKPDYIFWFKAAGTQILPMPGYEVCWPTHRMPLVAIYRRVAPLSDDELGLGMPPGMRRCVRATAPCARP